MAPLIPPPPPVRRLDRRKLGAVVLTLGVCLGGGLWWAVVTQETAQDTLRRGPRAVAEAAAEGQVPSASQALHIPSSYAQVKLPPAPEPAAPPGQAVTITTVQAAPNPLVAASTAAGGQAGTSTPAVAQAPPLAKTAPPAPAAKPPPKPPSRWLFADLTGGVQQPPFPVPREKEEGGGEATSRRADSLFPQAVWGTPADPTQVLYRSQVINGLLQHDVTSDQPGLIRILVTEAVQDRFGQGHTLLPQYTVLLGSQDGTVKFGQSRLGITIDSAELPDGTVVAFQKAKAGDATGATGVTGSVNNHWAQVGIGAVLTAALSVGSRAAAGSPTGFQPNLAQDFARDASQSINTTGQQIVRRSLEVAPTITIPHGTPVTVQLAENVSFQTSAATVRK